MKVIAKKNNITFDEKGNLLLSLKIENYRDKEVIKELQEDKLYRLEMNEVKSKRSIEQNKLLWAIIEDINNVYNGRQSGKDDVYCMVLERANIESTRIACTEEAEEFLKSKFRAVKRLGETITENGNELITYKCFIGSSKMNVKQMNELIEVALDIAKELDIDTNVYERSY